MIKSINRSIFRKLLFSYTITVLLGVGAVGLLIAYFAKGYIYDSTQAELLRKAKNVNVAIQNVPSIDQTEGILNFLDQSYNTRIWVHNNKGEIIVTSTKDDVYVGKSIHPNIVKKVLKGENAVSKLKFEGLTEPMISVVVPWGKEDDIYGGIVLHSPIVGLNETVRNIRETILWISLVGLLISTAMVSFLSWSISRPLKRIDRTAAEIGRGNYSERIHINSIDEIGELAQTVNNMAMKLEKNEQERNRFDQIKNEFFANVSHELRTPLTAMRGFLEALIDGLITEEEARQKYYGVMYSETLHMNLLVDDLMDLIRIENKEIQLLKQPIHVENLLNKVAFKFQQEASEKGTEIHVSVEDNMPTVIADPDRLEQILGNIVKNAVKFTEQGTIYLEAEEDAGYIRFSIVDTGIGISDADQEFIFERFFKVDRGRSKKNKGTGLGLAIVKELVELHEGKITVESKIGEGTTFEIWLPQQ
ncbi:sensor histidine kinase [Bacillus sp. Marseille-P3661]|uniref:sensor histidine kinase n=1 Tax=Bacillus sp. Marseille-P3661 TaxID=1936234 RepID=UPI002155CCB1|nr:cell wall metabolism sensor histidine kinase WalK [Bacillus sp. Marseille-P3661]